VHQPAMTRRQGERALAQEARPGARST
jgi:hypothetical protein